MKRLVILLLSFVTLSSSAQYASIQVGKTQQAYIDSLKSMEYNHVFPIWGAGAYKQGFDIPYPAGIMVNYFSLTQKMTIDNIKLGVNGNGLHDFSEIIEFSDVTADGQNVSLRPDLWVLPFLNVYGIFGRTSTKTSVTLSSPIVLNAAGSGVGNTVGFGTTVAGGVGAFWVAADFNWTWSYLDILHEPAHVRNTSVRFGHTFVNPLKPYRNVSIWLGLFGSTLNTETNGSISLFDAIEDLDQDQLDDIKEGYADWKDALDPGQRVVIERIEQALQDRIDENPDGDIVIDYSLDKELVGKWNMLAGFQYQLNKSWIFRTEVGFFGSRSQALFSLNYRFKI